MERPPPDRPPMERPMERPVMGRAISPPVRARSLSPRSKEVQREIQAARERRGGDRKGPFTLAFLLPCFLKPCMSRSKIFFGWP